ncbi:MAG: metalloregulator ArsR/SmtB family transcription factor [Chitinivibrionales bacterium]|nr:metalloregulator ArsR/SmtB family transcription factor [Chitinivibrionales bacterium]
MRYILHVEYSKPDINSSTGRLANLFSVLANPLRLSILSLLMEQCARNNNEGCCVQDINTMIDVPQPYLSKHLKILTDCGILSFRRDKNRVFYKFADQSSICHLFDFFKACCTKYDKLQKGKRT